MICDVCGERFKPWEEGSSFGWKENKYGGYEKYYYCSKECKARDEKP